jgi:hypothetical protein
LIEKPEDWAHFVQRTFDGPQRQLLLELSAAFVRRVIVPSDEAAHRIVDHLLNFSLAT